MLPWSTNQLKVIGAWVAHSTIAYKGLLAVHDSSISLTVTHWLSCTAPVWPLHGLVPLCVAIHRAQAHSLST